MALPSLTALKRVSLVTKAFVGLAATEAIAYPLVIAIQVVLGPASSPIIYRFIARLVESGPRVAGDYYTFVVLGYAIAVALAGGLTAFSTQVDLAIQQGRLETYLVQPISWYSLPFALAGWPIVLRLFNGAMVILLGLAFGAHIRWAGMPMALLVLMLGIAASHAIGILAASVLMLSKKADPVVAVYTLAASILSGAMFPVEMLPRWVRVVAYALPQTYVITAIRRVLMPGGASLAGPSLSVSIAVLVVTVIVLYSVSMFLFGRSLEFGRRYGILAGY